jgi:citrate lyase subunit beta/citryl-CoA lyase
MQFDQAEYRQPLRSILYAPGNQEKKLKRALSSDADAATLDLEDAVPESEKQDALRKVTAAIADHAERDWPRVIVRPNGMHSGQAFDEIEQLLQPALWGLALTKVGTVEDLDKLVEFVRSRESRTGMVTGHTKLIVSIDAPRLVLDLAEILRRDVHAVVVGGMDFAVNLDTALTVEMTESLWARQYAVMLTRAAGKAGPIHPPCMYVRDDNAVRTLMTNARDLGFHSAIAIHPGQVPIINEVFSPSPEEVAWAQATLRTLKEAEMARSGVSLVDDALVDEAMAKRARAIISRHGMLGQKAEEVMRGI